MERPYFKHLRLTYGISFDDVIEICTSVPYTISIEPVDVSLPADMTHSIYFLTPGDERRS